MSRLLLVLCLILASAPSWSAEPAAEPVEAAAAEADAQPAGESSASDPSAEAGEDAGPAVETPALVKPTRYLIGNERLEVSLSDWRASIGHVALKGMKPLQLPPWRGVVRDQAENESDKSEDWRLKVLDHEFHNPKFTWDSSRHGFGLTDMHNYLWGAGLDEGTRADRSYGPLEPLWQLESHDGQSATFVWENKEFGLTYRMRYHMDEERPTIYVEMEIINSSDQAYDLAPNIAAINGIYQDDPGNEEYDVAVIYNFGGGADGFDYQSLPDVEREGSGSLIPVVVADPNGNTVLDPQTCEYVGIKSRFFAAWWKPIGLEISRAPEEKEETATEEPDKPEKKVLKNKSLREGAAATTGPASAEGGDFRFKAEVFGFYQLNDTGDDGVRHGSLQISLLPVNGGTFSLEPGDKLHASWSLTTTSLDKESLSVLDESEQQVEYSDWWYRFFRILVAPLNWLLRTLYAVFGHYGLALIALVFIIKGLLHKLNVKTQTSMMKMQKLGPELKRLQDRYKADRQTLAMKQMELFKKEGVNPVGGCLPMLIQMPIFIALYQTFRHSADMRGQSFLWVRDLTLPDQLLHLFGPITLNPLPILYMAIMLWMGLSNKPAANAQATDQQRQMQMMMRWMPLIFGVIFYNMPAGLVLYFVLSAVFSAVELRYIRKKLGVTSGGVPTM